MGRYFTKLILVLLGIIAFALISAALKNLINLSNDQSYRLLCIAISLFMMWAYRKTFPKIRYFWISFWIALIVNFAIFLTPLVERSASRGEVLLFALPNSIIFLTALTLSYSVVDDRSRAMRQYMLLGIIVAILFSMILYASILINLSINK